MRCIVAVTTVAVSVQVFSFGVIAWQIFTGQGPHSGMAPMQV
jgi:hypothetical protein